MGSARQQFRPGFLAATLLAVALAGCGGKGLFPTYDLPESPDVAEAPWPRLVDTPPAPPVGSPGVPDPAEGAAVIAELEVEARILEEERRRLGLPAE